MEAVKPNIGLFENKPSEVIKSTGAASEKGNLVACPPTLIPLSADDQIQNES